MEFTSILNVIILTVIDDLINKGIEFDQKPTDQSWLWREARLKDMDGNQLILFYGGENRVNPPWRIENK